MAGTPFLSFYRYGGEVFCVALGVPEGAAGVVQGEPGECVRADGAAGGGGARGGRPADAGTGRCDCGVRAARGDAAGGPPAGERRIGSRAERGAAALLVRAGGTHGHGRRVQAVALRAAANGVCGAPGGGHL